MQVRLRQRLRRWVIGERHMWIAAEFAKWLTYAKLRPPRPRIIRLTSRVVQPPASVVSTGALCVITGKCIRHPRSQPFLLTHMSHLAPFRACPWSCTSASRFALQLAGVAVFTNSSYSDEMRQLKSLAWLSVRRAPTHVMPVGSGSLTVHSKVFRSTSSHTKGKI